MADAGLRTSNRINIPNEELFQNIADVWTKLGSQPFGRHMSDSSTGSRFSTGTYEKRFETWNMALIAFAAYIESAGNTEGVRVGSEEIGSTPKTKRTSRNINWRLRAKILIRDNCICQMCGASPAKDTDVTLHVDHIEAWANGGETVEENLQTLCVPCNIGTSNVL